MPPALAAHASPAAPSTPAAPCARDRSGGFGGGDDALDHAATVVAISGDCVDPAQLVLGPEEDGLHRLQCSDDHLGRAAGRPGVRDSHHDRLGGAATSRRVPGRLRRDPFR